MLIIAFFFVHFILGLARTFRCQESIRCRFLLQNTKWEKTLSLDLQIVDLEILSNPTCLGFLSLKVVFIKKHLSKIDSAKKLFPNLDKLKFIFTKSASIKRQFIKKSFYFIYINDLILKLYPENCNS